MLSNISKFTPPRMYVLAFLQHNSRLWRACAGLLLCLLLLGANLSVQAQNLSIVFGTVSDIWFHLNILSMPSDTERLKVRVWQGNNLVYDVAHQTLNASASLKLTIGDYQPENSPFKPQTSYQVEVNAKRRSNQNVSPWRMNVTTKAERKCYWASKDEPFANCPPVHYSDLHRGWRHAEDDPTNVYRWMELRITAVSGADFYKVPMGNATFDCDQEHSSLGALHFWIPQNRFLQSASKDAIVYKSPYTVYYCGLTSDKSYTFALEAYRWLPRQGNSRQAELIARKVHNIFSGPNWDLESAPASAPPPEPITLGVGIQSASDVSLQWSAVSGATGYLLEYAGGNNESGAVNLGAGATSHSFNGLTAGGNYTVYITAYLQNGGKRRGEISFRMPSPPPPTKTAVPTHTPVPPQQSPQDQPAPLQAEEPSQQQPSGPYASLIQNILGWRDEQAPGSDHHERWTRALAALGHGSHANPMTAAEAQTYVDRGWGGRWQPVVNALTQIEGQAPPPQATNTPVPPPTNTPVPPAPPTNTPPPPPPPPTNTPVPPPPKQSYSVPNSLIQTVRDYYDENVAAGRTGNNWLRVLIAFGVETHDELSPMSAAEARERVSRWGGWRPIAEALEQLEG